MFDVVFVKTPINQGNKKNIEPRLADGPININRKLPAGDGFGFRDAFGMLPEYFQMILIVFGMLLEYFQMLLIAFGMFLEYVWVLLRTIRNEE